MEINTIVDIIMAEMPKDSSGKWISTSDVRATLEKVLHPDWDYEKTSAYQIMKGEVA